MLLIVLAAIAKFLLTLVLLFVGLVWVYNTTIDRLAPKTDAHYPQIGFACGVLLIAVGYFITTH